LLVKKVLALSVAVATFGTLGWLVLHDHVAAQGAAQQVLGPGLYVFQTRLDHSTCEPPSTSGYVTSYFAAIDGTPGSASMAMHLLNSDNWPDWTVTVTAQGTLIADALQANVTGPDRAESHFELTRDRAKFTGRGWRSYTATVEGQRRRCRTSYDALLRKLHE
jgi:hypothetical protein